MALYTESYRNVSVVKSGSSCSEDFGVLLCWRKLHGEN